MEERIQKSYQKYHANAFQTLLHLYQEIIGVLPCQDSFYYQTSSILVNADRYCQCNQCSFIEDSSQLQAIYFNAF